MATHSSIVAWRIPWTEKPGGLQSMELQRVGHESSFMSEHAPMQTLTYPIRLWQNGTISMNSYSISYIKQGKGNSKDKAHVGW